MSKVHDKATIIAIKELLERDEGFVRFARSLLLSSRPLEAQMTETLAAEKGELASRVGAR